MSNGRFELPRPHTVAIVAMGGSSSDYINGCAQHGGRFAIADETWAINAMGNVIEHDRLFAMDEIGELTADMRFGKKVATGMMGWLPNHPGPVYTTRRYGDRVPGAIQYPIEEVVNHVGFPYLNNSVAYAVAYAMYIGVKLIKLFGCDFTYRDQHVGESGRGCVEWLLGIAGERKVKIEVSQSTTLLDADLPLDQRLYGFDEKVVVLQDPDTGEFRVTYPDREKELPKTEAPIIKLVEPTEEPEEPARVFDIGQVLNGKPPAEIREVVQVDPLTKPVGFGKMAGMTWRDVLGREDGSSYVNRYVLTASCKHESVTEEIREALRREIA